MLPKHHHMPFVLDIMPGRHFVPLPPHNTSVSIGIGIGAEYLLLASHSSSPWQEQAAVVNYDLKHKRTHVVLKQLACSNPDSE